MLVCCVPCAYTKLVHSALVIADSRGGCVCSELPSTSPHTVLAGTAGALTDVCH